MCDVWGLVAGPLGLTTDRLAAVADWPAMRCGLWEHWLAKPSRPPDAACRVAAEEWTSPGAEALIQAIARDGGEAGARLASMMLAAAMGAPPFDHGSAELWLERDDAGDLPQIVPNVFWRLPHAVASLPSDAGRRRDAVRRALSAILEPGAMVGRTASGEVLERVVDALPPSSYLGFAGAMTQRPCSGIRLTLSRFPLHGLAAFLARCHWPGELAPFLATLARIEQLGCDAALHLDVADALGPTLGLELAPRDRDQRSGDWDAILSCIRDFGWASPDDMELARRWPGTSSRWSKPEDWPAQGMSWNRLLRSINHLKLAYRGDGSGETYAKLYVAYQFDTFFPGPAMW